MLKVEMKESMHLHIINATLAANCSWDLTIHLHYHSIARLECKHKWRVTFNAINKSQLSEVPF